MEEFDRASRYLAYVLRHHPEELGFELDPEGGWVCAETLAERLNRCGRFKSFWTVKKLGELVKTQSQRFALEQGRICALGGHSVEGVRSRSEARRRERGSSGRARSSSKRSSSKRSSSKAVSSGSTKGRCASGSSSRLGSSSSSASSSGSSSGRGRVILSRDSSLRRGRSGSGRQASAGISAKHVGQKTGSGRQPRLCGRARKTQGALHEVEPPELLFHVMTTDQRRRMRKLGGLQPRGGQLLKLVSDWSVALGEARKSGREVVVVDAARAYRLGVRFFLGRRGLFRCGFLPERVLCSEENGFCNQRAAGVVLMRRSAARASFVLIRTRPRDEIANEESAGERKKRRRSSTRRYRRRSDRYSPEAWERERRRDAWSCQGRLELPKGKIEAEETATEAALRELREETGIEGPLNLVCQLPSVYYVYRVPGGIPVSKSVSFFLVRCGEEDPVFHPKNREGIIGVEWHEPEEALKVIAFDNLRPILRVASDLVSQGIDLTD